MGHTGRSKTEKQDRSPAWRELRWELLAGALLGATAVALGLVCLSVVMRSVGLDNGGSCVSGGPYEITPGHECGAGVFSLAFGGVFGLMVGFAIFLWSSHRYGGPLVVTAASAMSSSALFGGLGGNFLSIGSELPASSAVGSEFKTVGIVFLVMASFGLFVAFGSILFSMRSSKLDYPRPTSGAWLAWLATISIAAVTGFFAGTSLILFFTS